MKNCFPPFRGRQNLRSKALHRQMAKELAVSVVYSVPRTRSIWTGRPTRPRFHIVKNVLTNWKDSVRSLL